MMVNTAAPAVSQELVKPLKLCNNITKNTNTILALQINDKNLLSYVYILITNYSLIAFSRVT